MKKTLILLFVVATTGCSTVMTGTSEEVRISSKGKDVKVYVDEQYRGYAPLVLDLSTKESHNVRFGEEKTPILIKKKVSGWVWGNLFTGGFIGTAVDYICGGAYTFEKNDIIHTPEGDNKNDK